MADFILSKLSFFVLLAFNVLDAGMHFLSRAEICPKPPLLSSGVLAPFGQLVPGADRWNVKLALACFKDQGFRNVV
jgi:hypothetical protein